MRGWSGAIIAGAAALMAAGCGSRGEAFGKPQASADIMRGGQFIEPWLGQALAKAETRPLGSKENPVRAHMPMGQRAYLARLRCKNGQPPAFERAANMGPGVFGSIVDGYDVRCQNSEPRRTIIHIDMYFPGHVEARAVDGFTITPP